MKAIQRRAEVMSSGPSTSSGVSKPAIPKYLKKPKAVAPIENRRKVKRNAPCPCGSGRKFKSCHGR